MKEMLGNLVFSHRKAVVILFLVLTVFMAWQASHNSLLLIGPCPKYACV